MGWKTPGDKPMVHRILRDNPIQLVFIVMTKWSLLKRTLSFISTVLGRFFIDQFMYRMKPGMVPVKNIEHPLDAWILVRYEFAGVYLGFIKLWISALSYLRKRIGPEFDDDMLDFLVGLERCYADASGIYRQCLSTTRRPARAPCLRLAFVYAVDPHLFCVPSLHVLVVGYTYRRLRDLLGARGLASRFAVELEALRDRAIAITESILYVRQHSVNCIPAALSMLQVIVPSYDAAESKAFLSALFEHEPDLAPYRRMEVLRYMDSLYDGLTEVGMGQAERYGAIVDFLHGYESMDFSQASGEQGEAGTLDEA
jgi:hypothetical protein